MSSSVMPMDEDPGSPGPPPLQDQNGMEVTAPVQKSARVKSEVAQRINKEKKRVELKELNPHIVCGLCSGYLIDPVTVVECLHSFCKSCIIKHVEKSKVCPTCQTQIHKTKPLLSLRADKALQDIVYKVVPGLYKTEMKARLKHYNNNPQAKPSNAEDGGEVADSLFFSPEDDFSMSIEYFDNFNKSLDESGSDKENPNRRFLQCPGSVTVQLLKKFIMTKYSLDQNFLVDVIYREDLLSEDQTLIDVAYSYNWRKTSPMRFYYRIYQKTKVLTRKRKKKSTKTNNKSNPSKKRKTEGSGSLDKLSHNGMEVDEVPSKPPKIASKINGDGAKDKINGVKEGKKLSPVTKPTQKVSFGGVTQETKPVKSVTINQNVSYSNSSDRHLDKLPSKSKPLSPILKNASSLDKSVKQAPTLSKSKSPVSEVKSKPVSNTPASVNSVKPHHLSSKKSVSSVSGAAASLSSHKNTVSHSKPGAINTSVSHSGKDKKPSPESKGIVKESLKEKPVTQLPVTASSKVAAAKDKKTAVTNGVSENIKSAAQTDKTSSKIIPDTKKQSSENQVVEISVEVSASDIKKVLEKKRAEKDAKMIPNGEEKLYSNYSIVDQLKKSNAAAAHLANQKKQQASMMDFTRSQEALQPKVPPNVQGLQPKKNSGNELSEIVQSLVQKQASLSQKIHAATTNNSELTKSGDKIKEASPASVVDAKSGLSEAEKLKQSESGSAKSLGTMVATGLTGAKSGQDKSPAVTSMAPKLPISTSIKPITKDSSSATSVETSSSKGHQQTINFSKNSVAASKVNTTSESAKSTESLTKNIPAGTTVTVKTVTDNKQSKPPSPSHASSTKSSAFRMNLSQPTFSLGKGVTNPFTTSSDIAQAQAQALLQTQMSMALAQQQYLTSLNNPLAAAALSTQFEVAAAAAANANYINNINNTAANLVRAAAAITQSPMTTLAFTKPISSSQDNRFGLKIPQPPPAAVSRHNSPSVSNFGTSRLQVKVNSDNPKTLNSKPVPSSKPENGSSADTKTSPTSSSTTSTNKLPSAIHSMPAMIPFHDMKKVQAIPKTFSNTNRSPISSILNKTQNNSSLKTGTNSPPKSPVVTSANSHNLTESNPFKTSSPSPVKNISSENNSAKLSPANSPAPYKPVTKSLTKLVADLNSAVKQKKAENLLNSLKKTNENSLFGENKKSFGIDQNISEKPKEVTS